MAISTQSAVAPDLATQLSAILTGAGVALLTDRAFLRITGPDATRWLNGMVTNSIQSLQPGEGNYNFLLNAQGQIQGDCTIYRPAGPGDPAYILSTTTDQAQTIQNHLDKFIIMDDVELTPFTERGLVILGPEAPEAMKRIGLPLMEPLALRQTDSNICEVLVQTPAKAVVPQFEIFLPEDETACIPELQANSGATPVSREALEAFRILSGTPKYGIDIRSRDLPQETGQNQALHFSKGCYLGQEIVERIRSRGSVHRTFSGFELSGQLPGPGTQLTAESFARPVGEITSAAAIPLPGRTIQLALGYIRHEALERQLPLEYPGGTAVPVALPYQV
jgi:folate-binding protein YgfZ